MIAKLFSAVFGPKQSKEVRQLIAAHTKEQKELLIIKAQTLIDQLSTNDIIKHFEIMNTIQDLNKVALADRKTILIKGKAKTIAINYDRMSGSVRANYY